MADSTAGSCFTGFGDRFPGIHGDYRKEQPVRYCRDHDGAEAGEPELEALADAPVRGAVAVELEHLADLPPTTPKSILDTVARQVEVRVARSRGPPRFGGPPPPGTASVLPAGTGAGGRKSLRRGGGERERGEEEEKGNLN